MYKNEKYYNYNFYVDYTISTTVMKFDWYQAPINAIIIVQICENYTKKMNSNCFK